MDRITVNLAPADLRKEGSSFDLAIAIGILITTGQINIDGYETTLFLGELALDGSLRPIPGVLSMVHAAKKMGIKRVCVAAVNAPEAALIDGIEVCVIRIYLILAIGIRVCRKSIYHIRRATG